MDDLLNPNQRRSVRTTLRMFEESLRNADAWLQGDLSSGILYQQVLKLSPGRRQSARRRISLALEKIASLAHKIGLEPEDDDLVGLIRSDMSLGWASLIDCQSGKLVRFGEVDPRLGPVLDPDLLQLAELALELATIFNGQSPA